MIIRNLLKWLRCAAESHPHHRPAPPVPKGGSTAAVGSSFPILGCLEWSISDERIVQYELVCFTGKFCAIICTEAAFSVVVAICVFALTSTSAALGRSLLCSVQIYEYIKLLFYALIISIQAIQANQVNSGSQELELIIEYLLT